MIANIILYSILAIFYFYLFFSTYYYLFFAISYFISRERYELSSDKINSFAIIVPAHNEELLIRNLCDSLSQLNYPKCSFNIFIIADNCTDKTTEVCGGYACKVLVRNDLANRGKGQAIHWAINQIHLDDYNAILIIDADNYVDCNLLVEINKLLNNGEQAIQCCNSVGNRDDSWFTQLLFLSRTINNLLYHQAKYKLGLSSYLMGNGICFTTDLIKRKGWTAFTIGEDWEYYAQLLDQKIRIAFAVRAKVFHQESKSLNQATSQRLRWSSGRFYVAKRLGLQLFFKGIYRHDWLLVDASFPLLLPNYSLLLNLSFLSLVIAIVMNLNSYGNFLVLVASFLLLGQIVLLIIGVIQSGQGFKIIKALLFVPFFLIWKMAIDIVSFTGIYRGNKWQRTKRHISK